MSAKQITCRMATHHDLYWLVSEMERLGAKEAEWAVPQPDWAWVFNYALEMRARGQIFVASMPDGRAIGLMSFEQRVWPWNPNAKYWENTHLWVHPDYRKTGAAMTMIDQFKVLGDETGIPCKLVTTFGREPERELQDRYFRSRGLKQVGSNFMYEPRTQADLFRQKEAV